MRRRFCEVDERGNPPRSSTEQQPWTRPIERAHRCVNACSTTCACASWSPGRRKPLNRGGHRRPRPDSRSLPHCGHPVPIGISTRRPVPRYCRREARSRRDRDEGRSNVRYSRRRIHGPDPMRRLNKLGPKTAWQHFPHAGRQRQLDVRWTAERYAAGVLEESPSRERRQRCRRMTAASSHSMPMPGRSQCQIPWILPGTMQSNVVNSESR